MEFIFPHRFQKMILLTFIQNYGSTCYSYFINSDGSYAGSLTTRCISSYTFGTYCNITNLPTSLANAPYIACGIFQNFQECAQNCDGQCSQTSSSNFKYNASESFYNGSSQSFPNSTIQTPWVCTPCQYGQYSLNGTCSQCTHDSYLNSNQTGCICSNSNLTWFASSNTCGCEVGIEQLDGSCGCGYYEFSANGYCQECPTNAYQNSTQTGCICQNGKVWDYNSNSCKAAGANLAMPVGIAVGVAIVVLLLIICCCCCKKKVPQPQAQNTVKTAVKPQQKVQDATFAQPIQIAREQISAQRAQIMDIPTLPVYQMQPQYSQMCPPESASPGFGQPPVLPTYQQNVQLPNQIIIPNCQQQVQLPNYGQLQMPMMPTQNQMDGQPGGGFPQFPTGIV